MNKITKYFRELLATMKSIDKNQKDIEKHLSTLAECVVTETSNRRSTRVINVQELRNRY